MEQTLQLLIATLRETLRLLKGPLHSSLHSALHHESELPDANISKLAESAINLLHETEQLLEPPSLVLADYFFGYIDTKCLCAAVKLNIPDILHQQGPLTLSQLAESANANPRRLGQVIRVLYNKNIFTYSPITRLYSNNAASTLLTSSHWTQWRNWVDLYGNEFYDAARGIPASCKKEETRMAAQINFETDLDMFTYFQEQGWVSRLHKTLSGGAVAQAPGILEDYPWQEIANVSSGPGIFLDVGGGGGGLVASILRKHTQLQAAILDVEKVIGQATSNFHSPGGQYADVGPRVLKRNLMVGNFLKEVPAFEIYTMKWCLHDWDDTKAIKVLTNIRRSIIRGPKSRLVILESLLKDGRMGRLSRYGDIIMMVSANGKERTEEQWRGLADETGWTVRQIYHLRNAWVCAIEMVPIWGDDIVDEGISWASSRLVQENDDKRFLVDATACGNKKQLKARVVLTHMKFLEPWETSRGNPYVRITPDEGFHRTNFQWIERPVSIMDARPSKDRFQLDTHGFKFLDDLELKPCLLEALRSDSKEASVDEYYRHIKELVQKETGGQKVFIFNHTVRRRNPNLDTMANPEGEEQPAAMVHCDQSTKGAHRRIKELLIEGGEEDTGSVLSKRIQLINVWRPLRGPVKDWPLGVMNTQTVVPEDVFPVNLLKHQFEERGQTVTACHQPDQEWWYLDHHRTDEVTMLKIWDNKEGISGKFCLHAAFKDPDTPADAEPRQSIEVRCIILFDEM